MSGLRLYDYAASANCYKARLLLAQLGVEYERVAVDIFVGDAYSVADVAIYGYVHVAGEAGYDLAAYPHVVAWLERVRRQPGHMNDLQPYPANARAGAGRSIYN